MKEMFYGLYSTTRNILYVNDKPHSKFWSKYIQNKYPDDEWILMNGEDPLFKKGLSKVHGVVQVKQINLFSTVDVVGRALNREILEKMESCAIKKMEEYTFLALKVIRGEPTVVYLGTESAKALVAFVTDRGVECLEVWLGGTFVETIYDPHEFTRKYVTESESDYLLEHVNWRR